MGSSQYFAIPQYVESFFSSISFPKTILFINKLAIPVDYGFSIGIFRSGILFASTLTETPVELRCCESLKRIRA